MEELYRIHKDVPFGYWVVWLAPGLDALKRRWRRRHGEAPACGHDRIAAFR
jgi:hypothetical protein